MARVGVNPTSIAGLKIPYHGGQGENATKSDKARRANWQEVSAYCIVQPNFLWETESNRQCVFRLGNFVGIGHYPH
jgi:hypothetical protein